MTIAEIVRIFDAKKAGRDKWQARCPAHDDRSRNTLKITADNRGIALYCFAGCDTKSILEAAGLKWRDLFFHSRDLASEALARHRQRQRDQKSSDLRVGEWVVKFSRDGYTLEDRQRDMNAVCAAGVVLSNKPTAHWERILRTHMERILAAEHCRLNRMLPETKQFERDIEAAYR